jgi:hypothetical protein
MYFNVCTLLDKVGLCKAHHWQQQRLQLASTRQYAPPALPSPSEENQNYIWQIQLFIEIKII